MVKPTSTRAWKESALMWCAPSSLPTTATTATFPLISGRPLSSVSDSSPSSRSSTPWATLVMCPTQVGVAKTRMSAASSLSRIAGHSSPSPMSTCTPGFTSWSTTPTTSCEAPCSASAASTSCASFSLLDGSGEALRLQTRASACSDGASLMAASCPADQRLHTSGARRPCPRPGPAPTMEARPGWCAVSEIPSRSRGRFLMAVIDARATRPRAMGVPAELVRRGHSVAVLADPTVESSARAAGCDFTPWREAPHFDSVEDQTAMVIEFERGSPLHQFAAIRDRLIVGGAPGFAADVVRAVRDTPVDAGLAEGAVPGILIGAQATGLPVAALMPNIYLRPTPGLPMMGTGWRPAHGPLGRTRDAAVRWLVGRLSATCLPGLDATLADHGLPAVGDMFELLDRCAEVLVLTSPSFDFPARLPDNV